MGCSSLKRLMKNSDFMKAQYFAPDLKTTSFDIDENLTVNVVPDLDSSHDAIIDWSEI